MTRITVTTQDELDAALKEHRKDEGAVILIDSPRGVWLYLRKSDSATVRAYGSATVRAYGSATVRAYGSATVRAYGSATVEAYDSATVRAYGSATVRAYGSATVEAYDSATVRASDSATVRAYGSATVRAYGSATVEAYDSATVRASDSATVRAYGSATVRAYGSATVEAYDSATVQASDSATVEATLYVAVHLHSARATITGGHIIDVTALDLTDPSAWADYTGATVRDGIVTLYKAVDADLNAGHHYRLTRYQGTVTAPDWQDTNECGHGLHASPHPHQALAYYPGAKRMLTVTCPLTDLRPIPSGFDPAKAKARTFTVTGEVRLDGTPLGGAK